MASMSTISLAGVVVWENLWMGCYRRLKVAIVRESRPDWGGPICVAAEDRDRVQGKYTDRN